MNKRIKVLFIILLMSFYGTICPANNCQLEITSRVIPNLDQLPTKAIHRIFQDSDGFIWYGTFDGLCRYDGYDIKIFRSDTERSNLLDDNYITYITEDKQKQIWFGTYNGGCYILNKDSYKIRKVELKNITDPWIYSIYTTNDTVWVSTPGMLHCMDSKGNTIKQFPLHLEGRDRCVYLIHKMPKEEIIISTTGCGMLKLDRGKDELVPYYPHHKFKDIEKIIYDEYHDCYWMSTWGDGIIRFDPKASHQDSIYVAMPLPKDAKGKDIGNTYHMVKDDFLGYLWLTTEKGIHAFKITEDKRLKEIDTKNILPPGNKLLYEIHKDNIGRLWISAFDIESFIIDFNIHPIKSYQIQPLRKRLNANPSILSLYVDSEGDFWFLQERYGLCIYNPREDDIIHQSEIAELKELVLSNNFIFAPASTQHSLWIGTEWGAIFGIKKKNKNIRAKHIINLYDVTQAPGSITSLYEDSKQRLWIGTTQGIFYYDIKTNLLKEFAIQNHKIAGFTIDTKNDLWVAVSKLGIYKIQEENLVLKYSSDKDFTSIAAASNNVLWIGTEEGGVYSYNTNTEEWSDHNAECGNSSSRINKIFIDRYNHIWTTGYQQIGIYNPKNGAKKTYRTGDMKFLLGRLTPNAAYFAHDTFYFGGVNGIVALQSLHDLEKAPQNITTHISDIKINGHSIWDGISNNKGINNQQIQITSETREIQISFSALDYSANTLTRYACKLDGWDQDWVLIEEGKNSVSYSHLPKGKHILHVKCTDSNGVWSNQETVITIEKLPKFYETIWAYLIYIITTLVIILGCKRLYGRYKDNKSKEEIIDRMSWVLGLEQKEKVSTVTSYDEQMVNKASKIVEENLSNTDFDVQILAEQLNMSRSTLSRKIRTITGLTPSDFIKGIKMKHAAEMLTNPNISIAEVVNAVGYSNRKHFSIAFKNIFGIPPSEYQKKKETE